MKTIDIVAIIKLIDDYKKTPAGYKTGRDIIEGIFKMQFDIPEVCIITRLTVIDSLYSTNIGSRRLFGIEDIANEIKSFGDDKALRGALKTLTQNPDKADKKTINLFCRKYGITKEGVEAGRAVSLISKYCYFLMLNDGGFPIYDSLVLDVYPKLAKQLAINDVKGKLFKIKKSDISSLVKAINKLAEKLDLGKEFPNRNHYDLLDGYMWVVGKVIYESYSLVLSRADYGEFKSLGLLPTKIQTIKNHIAQHNLA